MKTLYPDISPFNSDYLVQGAHKIYFEESGNPDGKPVVFLHGGPGGGGDKNVRRFFNPELYRIVNFDQRGCGRSKPHGLLEENTTWHLVEDIEAIREKLNIDSWMVFGGSWGSTLALTYAQTHPEKVSEMVLRGIFLLRKKELDWFYQEGASKIFPDSWQKFIKVIEPDKRHNLMNAYYEIFKGSDKEMKEKAAVAWSQWEAATSSILINEARIEGFSNINFAIAFATIENHYFINGGFFKNENQLIKNIDLVRSIPSVIVQGRYDVVCPMDTAWELHQAWPEAEFIVADNSGHSAFEKEITHHLVNATDTFASR